jgi:hypothetical protein
MNLPDGLDFVLHSHVPIFRAAAETFDAYILVRKTGEASLRWVGRQGYTAKRFDLKCKTATVDVGNYLLNGLVCSPFIHPKAFPDVARRDDTTDAWRKSRHLITECSGFNADEWPRSCATPYLLQTDPKSKHYGVLAFVEGGILSPRYVHGDYDLYAIVPAQKVGKREAKAVDYSTGLGHPALGLAQQVKLNKPESMGTGPLLFRVMNHLDRAFGYPMVMHAEQENLYHKEDDVIVFLPPAARGKGRGSELVLLGKRSIEDFYRTEFSGRVAASLS